MPFHLSRTNRYLAALGGLSLLAIVLTGLAYGASESERLDIDRASAEAVVRRDLATELFDAVSDQEAAVDLYLLSRDSSVLELYDVAVLAESDSASALESFALGIPGIQTAIDDLSAFSTTWRATFAVPAIAAVKGGGTLPNAYTTAASRNHEVIDAALEPLAERLSEAEVALRNRGNALDLARTGATVFGLAIMLIGAALALWLIRRYGHALELEALNAGILNRFTEVTSFAVDDMSVASSNLEALTLLVHPDASVTHVLNRSSDRAVPEATQGAAIADVLLLGGLNQCAGLIRGSMYVVDDAAAPLSVRCPVYPVQHGTLACIPLSSGETVGAVHLYWERPNALPLELREGVVRIAEHAALGISNRRLLAALHGQANTDPRTGLANSRAFDRALEAALSERADDEHISVLMLDLDRFKDFNDRHGHPAGDEALRAFAGVLRSCMRDGDLAARYGGEEFAVLLPGIDGPSARSIAERIRSRTEGTVIALAPGQTARVTVSLGVATAPTDAAHRLALMTLADLALYQAKNDGRNRVASASDGPAASPAIVEREAAPGFPA